jgi:glyoxylase-like metal-dependent hydrolase (beta-lactamase superfamily II)
MPAVEVIPGLWWLDGTRGCNVYLVRASDGTFVLVDAGFEVTAGAVAWQARQVAGDAPVTHLLLTHGHPDHTGAAAALRDALGVRVVIGIGDSVERDDARFVRMAPLRRGGPIRRAIMRRRGLMSPRAYVPVDEIVEGRTEVVPGIEAVPVPGHTPGSVCYLVRGPDNPSAPVAALVGDLVISHRDGLARSLVAANADDALYLRTMAAFAEEAPEVGLAGHGYPVRSAFAAQLANLAKSPREPWNARNALRRARRMAAFGRMMWRAYPPRQ